MAPAFLQLIRGIKLSLLFVLLLIYRPAFAEGSKELCNNGGYRAFLVSGTTVTVSYVFPTNGTMKVYARVGEAINVGSSVQGIGQGKINLRAPNGNTYSSGTSTTVGLIANVNQETAGPLPNAGGYTPYIRTVQAGEEGVWEIDFIAANGGIPGGENPLPLAVGANWPPPSGQYISAFDVSVRNVGSTAFLSGRVYTNIFSGILGRFEVGFNGIFNVLTKDGYMYSLDNNGQAGNGFSFFVNNKGFRAGDGSALYKSVNNLDNPNIQDPRVADTDKDITYKIFFNPPASDLPATATTPGGSTTWLLNTVVAPTLTALTFTGAEGTPNRAGVSPLGGNIGFTANKNGTYTISIDVNKNGAFTDAIDRRLTGLVTAGPNLVPWDGLDGLGNKAPAGTNYIANIALILYGGEVHFPFFDVERNVNGIKLARLNGPAAPDFTVYWDDSPITHPNNPASPVTPSNPRVNTTGINSQLNGHKWGLAGISDNDFGNEKGLDTWTYIASTNLNGNVIFALQEAELEVGDITANASGGCIGQQISYTFSVKNNGPNNVAGAKLNFNFPADLTGVVVSSVPTTNASSLSNATLTATGYSATIDLNNGAVRTFTITGKVTALPTSGTVAVSAVIARTIDITDPNELNNTKSNTLAFQPPPDAGPDRTVFQNDPANITANGPGVWSQLGNLPVAAVIAAPAALSTDITGLSTMGRYSFLRTNPTGCTDTVFVNVVSKTMELPTVVTPNGDGKNDNFTIPNIELFPGSRLTIHNRWGNEVYRSDSYKNDWNGGSLAEGTYYYVLARKEATGTYTTFKGWLFLKR